MNNSLKDCLAEVESLLKEIGPIPFINSDASVARLHQAIYLAQAGDLTSACSALEECVVLNSTSWEAHILLGWFQFLEWKYEKLSSQVLQRAVDNLTRGIQIDETKWVGFYRLAEVLRGIDMASSYELYLHVLNLHPDHVGSLLAISRHLFHNEKRIDDALDIFDKVLERNPLLHEAWAKTNFYEIYLLGAESSRIPAHLEKEKEVLSKLRDASGLSKLSIRFSVGIVPFIGHYAYLDDVVKQIELGYFTNKTDLVVLAPEEQIVNPSLLRHYEKYVTVIRDTKLIEALRPYERPFSYEPTDYTGEYSELARDQFVIAGMAQKRWESEGRAPLLILSDEEHRKGREALETVGIPKDAWFVSLHVRDDGFKGADSTHALRNADIHTYIPAIQEITKRGGWVIRMGDAKMVPLPNLPNVFDYARSSLKSDWMDVFLWGACRFFIGGNSGPSWIPRSFGVPTLRVNWTPITRIPFSTKDLIIPKMFFDSATQRDLSLKELVDPNGRVRWTHSTDAIRERGLGFRDNSPEELSTAVVEMLARCEGTQRYTAEEESLQLKAAEIIKETCNGGGLSDCTCRFGMAFLRKYQNLL